MPKETTITLNGAQQQLVFKRLTVMRFAQDALNGADPLTFLTDWKNDPALWYAKVRAFVIAGLRGAGNQTEVSVIDEWIEDMTIDDGSKVINTAVSAILGGNGQAGEDLVQEIAEQTV